MRPVESSWQWSYLHIHTYGSAYKDFFPSCPYRTYHSKYTSLLMIRTHIHNIHTWNFLCLFVIAFWMVLICVEITESTEMSMRLNSSKQPQAPHWHRPENNLPTACKKGRHKTVDIWLHLICHAIDCLPTMAHTHEHTYNSYIPGKYNLFAGC